MLLIDYLLLAVAVLLILSVAVYFDNPWLAQSLGIVALVFILFDGALQTRWIDISAVLWRGISLATIGVMMIAAIVGWLASSLLDLPILQGHAPGTHRLLNRCSSSLHGFSLPAGQPEGKFKAPAPEKQIVESGLPEDIFIAMIKRDDSFIIPTGCTILQSGDALYALSKSDNAEYLSNLRKWSVNNQEMMEIS